MKKQRIFITGGAGYVGAMLVPELVNKGYDVTVFDLMIYGDDLFRDYPQVNCIEGDIRNRKLVSEALIGHDAVIHLACISNDPSFDLNPDLGRSINLDAFEPLVNASKTAHVKRFIYASSSSVYGVKNEPNVHEEMSLEPLTDYSKFKAECENILSKYQSDDFTTITIRPATVCGYSPRQRLDVVVNILTNLAYHNRKISIFGGKQLRPNIHIKDMVDAYLMLLDAPKQIVGGKIYNAGYQNHSISEIAEIVKAEMGDDVEMEITPTDDNRSYHVSSKKIFDDLGFEAKRTIADAVKELKYALETGKLENPMENELYYNIKRMQSINLR